MKIKLSPDGNANGNGSVGQKFNQLPKPEQPKEPPKEIMEMNFSTDSLPRLDSGEGGQIISTSTGKVIEQKNDTSTSKEPVKLEEKQEVTSKVEEKKEEKSSIVSVLKAPSGEKKEDKTGDNTDKKEVIKQITPPQKGEFDYSSYTSEEKSHLENMSKPARAFAGKLIKDNKELAKLKDSNYLQHPDAYSLAPEFRELQNNYQMISFEIEHYRQQLLQCKAGKNVRDILSYKDGKPVFSDEIKPTDEIEEVIRTLVNNGSNVQSNLRSKLQEFPGKFQGQIKNDHQAIEQERIKRFAWRSDNKLMDYTININGAGDKTLKQVEQDFISLFPTYLHNNVGVKVAADMMIAMVIQKAELDEALKHQKVAETKVEEVKRTEPSSTVKPGKETDPIGGVRTFSLDGMPK